MNTTTIPAAGKAAARQGAEALRTYDGLDAIARYRAEHGWHIYVRGQR